MKKEDLLDIFCLGVDYGQLIMEEERDSEDLFTGFLGHCFDKKYSMPMSQNERRQPHSKKWREAKKNSYLKFLEIYKNETLTPDTENK